MSEELKCPRCGGTEFWVRDAGPDSYEDDISYTVSICKKCGLFYDGWKSEWRIRKNGDNIEYSQDSYDNDVVEFSEYLTLSTVKEEDKTQ